MTSISSSNFSNRLFKDYKTKFKNLNPNLLKILKIRITLATTSQSPLISLSMEKLIIMNLVVKMICLIKTIFKIRIKNILWIFRNNNNS